jgi:WD40 repeat protein
LATLYDTLGVSQTADVETVRRAYRRLARKYHPDINPDPSSHDVMARINDAFHILSDPAKRMEYDAVLAGGLGVPVQDKPAWTPKAPLLVRLERRIRAHKTPIYGVDFDGIRTLITSSFDNEICWWDAFSAAQLRREKLESGVVSTLRAIKGNGVVTAGAAENQLSICRIGARGIESFRSATADWASCAAVSPDGSMLATGSIHKRLMVSDTHTGKRIYAMDDHAGSVTALAWSDDGRFLASGSSDTTIRIRDAATGKVLTTLSAVRSTITAIALSFDNRYLAVAGVDLSVRVFSLGDGQLKKVMFGHTLPIEALAFHPNGWLFASGGRDGKVGLWAASEGIGQLQIEASHRPVLCLAFNEDGSLLAEGGLDRTARIWRLTVREQPKDD